MKILLALLASVALLASGGARADAELTISARTLNSVSYRTYDNKTHLNPSYGEDITVLCTATNAANLTIVSKAGEFQAEPYNSTTMYMLIKKPDVGKHTYDCTCSTGYTQSLIVTVYPSVKVTSPNVRSTNYSFKTLYFVPRGEDYDVSCSANDLESLSLEIYLGNAKKLKTEVVNATISASVNDTKGKSYLCRKEEIIKFFDVIVDNRPEARDFHCELNLRHKLECTWSSSSTKNTFKLFHKEQLLCTDMSGNINGGCQRAWNMELDDAYAYSPITEHLPLNLEVCNEVYCENQTFSIKIKSIIKLDPVYNLQVKYTKKQMTSVDWRHRNLLCYRECEFKVEYRLAGMYWREAVSPIESYDFTGGVWNRIQLPLPCPNTQHEIRVYVKALSASEDRFWSEPASVVYVTPPSSTDTESDEGSCEEFRRQEPSPGTASLLEEARELVKELDISQKIKLTELKALLDKVDRMVGKTLEIGNK